MQLTVSQAAELLRASESQVRRWIRGRGLPAVRFNEQYRLNRLDVMVWAQAHQLPLADAGMAPAAAGGLQIASALRRGGIHRQLAGRDRHEFLGSALAALDLPPGVDRELLRELVVARELRDTSAIGHGIAIPHARYPIVAAVPAPILGLCFAATPVDFDAPDGAPVVALFVLSVPTIRAHLSMLSRLAGALSADLLAPVAARASDQEILAAAEASDRAAARGLDR